MKSHTKVETSVFKQEIVIMLKKLSNGHKSIMNGQIKQTVDNIKGYLEKNDHEFCIDDFFYHYFDLFKQCLEKQDKKLDLLIFEFFEKIQKQYLVSLDKYSNDKSLRTQESNESPAQDSNILNKHSDYLISEFCRMFDHKDYKLTQRLIQFIHTFITLSCNKISPLTLNKIVCNYLITYFEVKNSNGNTKLIDFIDVCLDNMIKFLIDDLELHNRLIKSGNKSSRNKNVRFLKNDNTLCTLMLEYIIEEAMLIAEDNTHKLSSFSNIENINVLCSNRYFNSKNIPNGKFGWCFICKNPANYYCIKQKLPICSIDCKMTLNELIYPSEKYEEQKLVLIQVVLKYFVKLSSKRNENMNIEFKAYVLSKILLLFKNSGIIFLGDSRTINRTWDLLSNELLHNFCYSENRVFVFSVQIFSEIVRKYRKTFKKEIKVMIKHVLMNLLRLKEFKDENKMEILKLFRAIIFDIKTFTYFYLHFDLSLYENFSIQEIISYIVKSAQLNNTGSILSPVLVTECIQIMYNLIHKALSYLKYEKDRKMVEAYINVRNDAEKNNLLDMYVDRATRNKIADQRYNIETLSAIITKFNVKHTSIVKNVDELSFYLPEIDDPSEKLAHLFYYNLQVSKSKLGHFFGEPEDIYQKALSLFFDYEDYKGLRIDEAMSSFMNLFDLPSESQKIDRILQKFAFKYSKDNPNLISEKCAYGLSFLVMMLQSEWHNPQVIEKMSYEQFMKLGMNIEDYEKYLSESLMKGIYNTLTKKPLESPDYYRGSNDITAVNFTFLQGSKFLNKKKIINEPETSLSTRYEHEYVFIEYFIKDLAEALIISLSMSYESTKSSNNCVTLSQSIVDLLDIFIILNNKANLEQLVMAASRLTALDKLNRPLEHKNIIILTHLLDFIKHNCDNLTSNCLKIWFAIFINIRYYSIEPTPYESVLKKNNYHLLKECYIDEKIERFIFEFFDLSRNQLKIYQIISLLFELINGLLADSDLYVVIRFILDKLFDYFKYAFHQKKNVLTLQSFYNVIISNCLNTISNLYSVDEQTSNENDDIDNNLVLFIIFELGEIVKLFSTLTDEETNVFKPYEMLLSNLHSQLIRQRFAILFE